MKTVPSVSILLLKLDVSHCPRSKSNWPMPASTQFLQLLPCTQSIIIEFIMLTLLACCFEYGRYRRGRAGTGET